MAGKAHIIPTVTACDFDERIVLRAVHDQTGWRVQLHLHAGGECALLEGYARFPDEHSCHIHGQHLSMTLDTVIGLTPQSELAPAAQTGN